MKQSSERFDFLAKKFTGKALTKEHLLAIKGGSSGHNPPPPPPPDNDDDDVIGIIDIIDM